MVSEVAPDESPAPFHLPLPAGATPALIDSAIARSTILELARFGVGESDDGRY